MFRRVQTMVEVALFLILTNQEFLTNGIHNIVSLPDCVGQDDKIGTTVPSVTWHYAMKGFKSDN